MIPVSPTRADIEGRLKHASVLSDYAKNCPDFTDGGPGIEESLDAGAEALEAIAASETLLTDVVADRNQLWDKLKLTEARFEDMARLVTELQEAHAAVKAGEKAQVKEAQRPGVADEGWLESMREVNRVLDAARTRKAAAIQSLLALQTEAHDGK